MAGLAGGGATAARAMNGNEPQNQPPAAHMVSIKDFGALGDGKTDDTEAIRRACAYCAKNKTQLFVPNPEVAYLISDTILVNNFSLVGEAPFGGDYPGQFLCMKEFVAFELLGQRTRTENIGVFFSLPSAATRAVGFRLGSKSRLPYQWSCGAMRNCWVKNAWRGFTFNETTGPGGIWGAVFEQCFSDGNVDWGFHFEGSSASGSTTIWMNQCMVFGPKGFRFKNLGDVICGIIDVDLAVNQGIEIDTCIRFAAELVRFEEATLSKHRAALVRSVASELDIAKIDVQILYMDAVAGRTCSIVSHSAMDASARFGEMTIADLRRPAAAAHGDPGAPTPYKYSGGAWPNYLQITDKDLTLAECDANGYDACYKINGVFQASSFRTLAAAEASWQPGEFVRNSTPVEKGNPGGKYLLAGWRRATSGRGQILNRDWFEVREITGN